VVKVGSDRVVIGQDGVVIEARNPMDWPVREFARVPVYFENQKFRVVRVTNAPLPYAKTYELAPWPADVHEESNRAVFYDADYVALRDATAREQRQHDLKHQMLLPFYPFLGLLWSGFKNRVLWRWGFEARSITSASVALVFGLFLAEGIAVGWLVSGLLTQFCGSWSYRKWDLLLTAVLFLDSVMRYSQLLQLDVGAYWGFCEWLWPRRKEKL